MDYAKKWVGIDGGGTQTRCVIGDRRGRLLAFASGPSSNIQSQSFEKVRDVLFDLIHDVLIKSNASIGQLEMVHLSLAGGDRAWDKERISQALQFLTSQKVPVFIENDARAALAAGTWGEPGIVLIAGTGSIAYYISPDRDKWARVGGWGYLIGDEGSGFDIGRQGVAAVMKQFDGRGPSTLLTEKIKQKLGVANSGEMVPAIYGRSDIRSRIASLSQEVFQAAKQNDPVSCEIVDNAREQLRLLIASAKNQVGEQMTSTPLVASGGLFQDPWFKNIFNDMIDQQFKGLSVIYPSLPPVVGSISLALKESGVMVDEDIKKAIENSWRNLTV